MNQNLGRAAVAAMIVFGAASASAQITTVIAAPKQPAPNAQQVAQRVQATQDSVARVTLTGMTQWVDSAANAMALRPDTGATAAAAAVAPATQPPPVRADSAINNAAPPKPTDEFRNGARAPSTATTTPAIALAGAALILVGFAVRRRGRHAPARVSR